MDAIKVGYAMCGSFCTFKEYIKIMALLKEDGYDIYPIMSQISYTTDTRFGKASDFITQIETICGRPIMHTIPEVEPVGPKAYLDILLIAPCTGNTLGKLANGITDTSVTMAAKGHLRNGKPVLIAVSTNDALSASAKNIGLLMNNKNIFFVPMSQDDPVKKPTSMMADCSLLPDALKAALVRTQLQPIYK